jgi:hypothetical protein
MSARKVAALSCCAIAAALAQPASAVAPTEEATRTWIFRVLLDGDDIGQHRFTLRNLGAERRLLSEARFDVKLLFFSAYRYAHDAEERWQGDCIAALTAHTSDNGKLHRVEAARADGRLTVASAAGRVALDGCVKTFAYWNPAILREPRLLNAQTGEYMAVSVAALGEEIIAAPAGTVRARRYALRGRNLAIDLWYSTDNEWFALESTTEGGRRLRYLRVH